MSCKLNQIQSLINRIHKAKADVNGVSLESAIKARDLYIRSQQIANFVIAENAPINNKVAMDMMLKADPKYIELKEARDKAFEVSTDAFEGHQDFMKRADGTTKLGWNALNTAREFLLVAEEKLVELRSRHATLSKAYTTGSKDEFADVTRLGFVKEELAKAYKEMNALETKITKAKKTKKTSSTNVTKKQSSYDKSQKLMEEANASAKALKEYTEATTLSNEILTYEPTNMQNPANGTTLGTYFSTKQVKNALARVGDLLAISYKTATSAMALSLESTVDRDRSDAVMEWTEKAVRDAVKKDIEHSRIMTIDVVKPNSGEGYQNISQLIYKEINNAEDGKAFYKNREYTRELPPVVVTAIALAVNDWVSSMKGSTWDMRSNEDINRFFGDSATAPVSNAKRAQLDGVDVLVPTLATDLGAAIVRELGIIADVNKNVLSAELLKKLEAELGLIGVQTAMRTKYITVDTQVPATKVYGESGEKDIKLSVVTITDSMKAKMINPGNTFSAAVDAANKLWGTDSRIKKPRMEAHTEEKVYENKSKQSTWTTVAPITQKAMNRHENVSWEWNESFMSDFRYEVEDNYDEFKKLLGWKEPADEHKVNRKGVESRNNAIEKEIRDLLELHDEMARDGNTELFFNYFFGKNGRFYMDSNTVNLQSYKSQRGALNYQAATITEDNVGMQELAFAQAFGIDIDKLTPEAAIKEWRAIEKQLEANKVHELPVSDVIKLMRDGVIKGADGKAINIATWHAMMGISNYRELKAYKDANNGSMIGMKAKLSFEIDGITNGYIIKTLQMPLHGSYEEHLQSGGVFIGKRHDKKPKLVGSEVWIPGDGTSGVVFKFGSFGEQAMSTDTNDNYQKPAKEMNKHIAEVMKDPNMNNDLVKRTTELTMNAELGSISDPTKLPEIVRSFMKEPFMIFNYGAGMKKIIDTLVNGSVAKGAMDRFYDLVIAADKDVKAQDQIEALILSAEHKMIKGKKGKWVVGTKDNLSKEYLQSVVDEFKALDHKDQLEWELPKVVEDNLASGVRAGLGQALELAFEPYMEYVTAADTINKSFQAMFRLFQVRLDKRMEVVKEALGRDVLTADEIDTIIGQLEESMPMIRTALAEGAKDNLLIYKEGTGEYNDANEDASYLSGVAKLKLSEGAAGKTGNKTLRAQAKRRFLIESFASGGVIPIHFTDGAAMSQVLAESDALGVHDALFVMADNALDVAIGYNKAIADITADYSITNEVLSSLNESLNAATGAEIAAVDEQYLADADGDTEKATSIAGIADNMVDLHSRADLVKSMMLSNPIRYEQMALGGGHYDWNMEGKEYKPKPLRIKLTRDVGVNIPVTGIFTSVIEAKSSAKGKPGTITSNKGTQSSFDFATKSAVKAYVKGNAEAKEVLKQDGTISEDCF